MSCSVAQDRINSAFSEGVGIVDLRYPHPKRTFAQLIILSHQKKKTTNSDLGLHELPARELASLAMFTTFGADGVSTDVSLFAARNQLTTFPACIIALNKNLHVLSLRANRISHIPREIGQLTQLKELSVSNNNLSYLPYEIERMPNLKLLQASVNPFVPPSREDAPHPVPSLRELALRAVHKGSRQSALAKNVENVLPVELVNELNNNDACSVCDGPIFSECHKRFVRRSIHSSQNVTVRYLLW